MADADRENVEQAKADIGLIDFLIRRGVPSPQALWTEGSLHFHIIADGLASSSTSSGRYTHWFYDLAPALQKADAFTLCRGFSYSTPNHHYPPRRTKVSFSRAGELVRPYLPITNGRWSATYHTFSLAGPLFVLGLSKAIDTLPPLPKRRPTMTGRSNSLVLLQPAFLVSKAVTDAVYEMRMIPKSLRLLARSSRQVWNSIDQRKAISSDFLVSLGMAIDSLKSRVTMKMFYWPKDQFIAFPESLLEWLSQHGIMVEEITVEEEKAAPSEHGQQNNKQRRRGEAFLEHCKVPKMTNVLTRISEEVS